MTTATAEPTPVTEQKQKSLQDDLMESARRVWLAGLGALATAGDEGTRVFNRLVERGREVEGESKDTLGKTYERARDSAKSTWKDLGSSLDETLTATLHRLGVPTRDEILTLTRRVEELSAKVDQLKTRPAEGHEAEHAAKPPRKTAG
jgi:poly(hydroxyalkanoate) granule-associated protein